eukprot:COSAG02_NODE_4769_length_4999_cov_3.430612_3_plen_955_part_00
MAETVRPSGAWADRRPPQARLPFALLRFLLGVAVLVARGDAQSDCDACYDACGCSCCDGTEDESCRECFNACHPVCNPCNADVCGPSSCDAIDQDTAADMCRYCDSATTACNPEAPGWCELPNSGCDGGADNGALGGESCPATCADHCSFVAEPAISCGRCTSDWQGRENYLCGPWSLSWCEYLGDEQAACMDACDARCNSNDCQQLHSVMGRDEILTGCRGCGPSAACGPHVQDSNPWAEVMSFEALYSGPPVPPAGSVMAKLPVSTDIADIPVGSAAREAFVSDFAAGVSALLDGVSASQVSVSSIEAGSSVVNFVIRPRSDCGVLDCPSLDVDVIAESFAASVTVASGIETTGPIADVAVQPEIGFTKIITSRAACGHKENGMYMGIELSAGPDMWSKEDCAAACTDAGAACRAFSWFEDGTVSEARRLYDCQLSGLPAEQCSALQCVLCASEAPAGTHYAGNPGDVYARGNSCPAGMGMPALEFTAERCEPCPEGKLSPIAGYGACLDACPYDFHETADHDSCVKCPEGSSTGQLLIPGGATDASYCATCAADYYEYNGRCVMCPDDGSAMQAVHSGMGLVVPVLLVLAFYRLADNVLLDEQSVQSTQDSAKDAVVAVGSTSSMLTTVIQSLQFTTVAWQLEVQWPSIMMDFGSWFGQVVLPDLAGILALECTDEGSGTDGPGMLVLKFFLKQALFMLFMVIFGLLSKFAPGAIRLRAVHALAASYSLLFMMYAKTMFEMTALTHHSGPDYFGNAMTLSSVLSSGPAQSFKMNSGEFYYMDTVRACALLVVCSRQRFNPTRLLCTVARDQHKQRCHHLRNVGLLHLVDSADLDPVPVLLYNQACVAACGVSRRREAVRRQGTLVRAVLCAVFMVLWPLHRRDMVPRVCFDVSQGIAGWHSGVSWPANPGDTQQHHGNRVERAASKANTTLSGWQIHHRGRASAWCEGEPS